MKLPIDDVRKKAIGSINRIGLAVGRRAATSEEFEKMERDALALIKACSSATVIFQNEKGEFVNSAEFEEAAKGVYDEPMTEPIAAAFVDANAYELGVEPPLTRKFLRIGSEYGPVLFEDGHETDAIWSPQFGSQELYLRAPTSEIEVCYEGTRGPGKTDALIMDFCMEVGKGWGAEWKGIIFRQTHPMLEDAIGKSKKWIKRIWPGATFNSVSSMWTWPTGETLRFAHFSSPSNYDDYHGHAYPFIGWEELTTWPDDKCYRVMFSCNRSPVEAIPRRVRSTTNPYGVGHNWVKARFQLPVQPGKILGTLITDSKGEHGMIEPPRRAIHGNINENKILMVGDPDYKGRIATGARNSAELSAWIDGSWDIVAGGMFDDVWSECKDTVIVEPFDVPAGWKIYRAYDHGSSKPFSVGWYAVSNGDDLLMKNGAVRATVPGDIFRIREWYGCRSNVPNEGLRMLVADIARGIIEREIQWGWRSPRGGGLFRVSRGPADTSIFDEINGISVSHDFERSVMIGTARHSGVFWELADKGPGSRQQGWEQMRKRLKATKRVPGAAREIPGLFISTDCPSWLATVPVLPRDERNMDDVDTDSEDHIGDENRYFLRFNTAPMVRSYSVNSTAGFARGRRATC